MKTKIVSPWTATMTIGQRRGYSGPQITAEELHNEIKSFQNSISIEDNCAVKIIQSKVQFRNYYEFCWDINVINYPRFPKAPVVSEAFIVGLGQCLLEKLEQNRITICLPDKHIMLESNDAEQC